MELRARSRFPRPRTPRGMTMPKHLWLRGLESWKMKTILIVDDEPAARYGLRRALESKYRIAEANSAEAAREALPREQPDLVLLDVVLPGQDGLSFLKWMREQGSEV